MMKSYGANEWPHSRYNDSVVHYIYILEFCTCGMCMFNRCGVCIHAKKKSPVTITTDMLRL